MTDERNIVDAEVVDSVSESAANEKSTAQVQEENTWQQKILSADHWLRFVFMALFAGIACVASYVVAVLIVIQFIFALVTGNSNERLRAFGACLSQYIFQILSFLTYNSEEKPFPFADWPEVIAKDDQ